MYTIMIGVHELEFLWSCPKTMDNVELHNDIVNKVASMCLCDLWLPNGNESRPVMAFGSTIPRNPRSLLEFTLLTFQ